MGRSPCYDASGLKRGPWSPEEDQKLIAHIQQYGHGSWRSLPQKAGLQRCGKSCRLRWINYLKPDIKRGKFSLHEEQTIIQLHALLGNRWSAIAAYLHKRTDNEIKNYWNTHIKKRLGKVGIDPVTHKRKTPTLNGDTKNVSNLSHMAQWENARLEAEARLVKESKQRQNDTNNSLGSISASIQVPNKMATRLAQPPCLDILKAWQKIVCFKSIESGNGSVSDGYKAPFSFGFGDGSDLESPTSTWNYLESTQGMSTINGSFDDLNGILGTCGGEINDVFATGQHYFNYDEVWTMEPSKMEDGIFMEGLSNILFDDKQSASNTNANTSNGSGGDGAVYEDKNYWNDMVNLGQCGQLNSLVYMPIL